MYERLLVGAARADITPPVGSRLLGYEPGRSAEKVHDALEADCVAFSQEGQTALLLIFSLTSIKESVVSMIRSAVTKSCNVEEDSIIICATHSHSAPCTYDSRFMEEFENTYIRDTLVPCAVCACKKALSNLTEAEFCISTVPSQVGINRRQMDRKGNSFLGQNPWGIMDSAMTLLAFRDMQGQGIVNLIHYGAHCTAAGAVCEISRDWPGIMQDCMEETTHTLTFFLNGSEGNVGPRLSNGKTVGSIPLMEELGRHAAEDALNAYKALDASRYHSARLGIFKGSTTLPFEKLPSVEALEKELADTKDSWICDRIKGQIAFLHSGKKAPESITLQRTLLSLGDLIFVPFPCEIMAETSLRIRDLSPLPHTLCLSNANGYFISYLSNREQFARGGFEPSCFLYDDYGERPTVLTRNAEDLMVESSLDLIDQAMQSVRTEPSA